MSGRVLKRAIVALPIVAVAVAMSYAYVMTRRERQYHRLVADGDSALARGDPAAAVAAFGHAIGLKPESMLGYLKRGDAQRRRGELEAAAVDLERARQLEPTEPRSLELLGDVAAARQLHDRAAEYYSAYLKLDDRARVFYKLGLSQHLAGRHSAAVDTLRQAIRADSRLAEAHYLLGVCLRATRRPSAAHAALERAVALSPGLLVAREELAEVYGVLGRRPERIKQLEALLIADPGPARHVTLAVAYANAGQAPRAIRMLRVAADLYPAYPGTSLALGKVWLDLGVADNDRAAIRKAIEALQQAVSMEASSAALMLLGLAHLHDGDTAAAERTLRQATETLPADPAAFRHLADAADETGRFGLARTALIDYATLTGAADPDFLARLAEAHWRAGDAAAARTALARVFDKDPQHQRARDLARQLR